MRFDDAEACLLEGFNRRQFVLVRLVRLASSGGLGLCLGSLLLLFFHGCKELVPLLCQCYSRGLRYEGLQCFGGEGGGASFGELRGGIGHCHLRWLNEGQSSPASRLPTGPFQTRHLSAWLLFQ